VGPTGGPEREGPAWAESTGVQSCCPCLGGLWSALRNGAFGCYRIVCKYPTRRIVDTLTCVMNKGMETSI